MPCSVCKDLETLQHEISALSVRDSSKAGCRFCKLLVDGVSAFVDDFEQLKELHFVQDSSLYIQAVQHGNVVVKLVELFTDRGKFRPLRKDLLLTFPFVPDAPSIAPCLGPARAVSDDSSSQECIELARQWLDQCLSSHPQCRRKSTPTLPTRVVSVGSCDEEVKLTTNSSLMEADYVALSHCWGGHHPVVLTRGSHDALHERIKFDAASKTFRDAVRVTRSLGIPYLWIDSLCILQDSDDVSDWEREAADMGRLYSNATVTISAASAADTSGGLFVDAHERSHINEAVQYPFTRSNGEVQTVFARARTSEVFDTTVIAHSSAHPETPRIASRGWVLQEDNLSPRMLHFRKEELAWTCLTYSQCECRIRPSLPQYRPFRTLQGFEMEADVKKLTASTHTYWPTLVMEYTRRNLTKITDRVAALNGLATLLENRTDDMYVSGLWHDDLAFQVLWYVDPKANEVPPVSRFEEPYAPSWSWMSIPGIISYWDRYPSGSCVRHKEINSDDAIDTYLRVVNVGRLPVGLENRAGPLIRGELMLYAYTLPVRFDTGTEQWQTSEYHIADMMPGSLRTYIDVQDDLPKRHTDRSYVFIFAGKWVAQGITLSCFETVCILARRMSLADIEAARTYQGIPEEQVELVRQRTDRWKEFRPQNNNSYHRIGMVRNTGSIKAWKEAGIPFQPAWLL